MRFVIIDRYPITRVGLREFLKTRLDDVDYIEQDLENGRQDNIVYGYVDLFIIGTTPYVSSDHVEDIRAIRRHYPTSPILLYYEKSQSLVANLLYLYPQVDGIVPKTEKLEEVLKTIECILDGKRYVSEEILRLLLDIMFFTDVGTITSKLTPVQFEIARFLCEGKSISWIASELKRQEVYVSNSKKLILRRLGVTSIERLKSLLSKKGERTQ